MANYTLNDLLYLMQRLRDPEGGCPWDRAQGFSTIAPHTLEECYELVDAIEMGDYQQIREELGDVLFQVVFYSQLGSELGEFDFLTIVDGLVAKLLRRHPHVFPDGTLASRVGDSAIDTIEVKRNWEKIKSEERQEKKLTGVLDDVPVSLPALNRAMKLQKRASQVGFDWSDAEGVIAHLNSELAELQQAREQGDESALQEEFGDLLFCLVNLARHWKLDPESTLRAANRKFETRFKYIEKMLLEQGSSPEQASLEEMDRYWDEAKQKGL